MSDTALVRKCMDILREQVGIVEAERFIYVMRTDAFDYTEWQKDHYDRIAPATLDAEVDKHSLQHPFKGEKATVI